MKMNMPENNTINKPVIKCSSDIQCFPDNLFLIKLKRLKPHNRLSSPAFSSAAEKCQVQRFVRHPGNLPYNPFARHILWNLQDARNNASVNRNSISRLSQTGKNAERPKAERIKALA
jgi:hypothetical protein